MVDNGVLRVVDAIIQSEADLVSLNEVNQEMSNDFHFLKDLVIHLNQGGHHYNSFENNKTGILSKFPIVDTETLHGKRDMSKAIIKTPSGNIAFYSVHLDWRNYAPYMPRGQGLNAPVVDADAIVNETLKSNRVHDIKMVIDDAKNEILEGKNVLISGDFNEPSHRDWTPATKNLFEHNGAVVEWPVTKLLEDHGFTDSYRHQFPNPVTHPGITWPTSDVSVSPERVTQGRTVDERDRIDFIFFTDNENFRLIDSAVFGPKNVIANNKRIEQDADESIIEFQNTWPSDHRALISTFRLKGK